MMLLDDDKKIKKAYLTLHETRLMIMLLFLSSADFFSKLVFSNNSFMNTISVSNGLDPDIGPISKLFAKVISRRLSRR